MIPGSGTDAAAADPEEATDISFADARGVLRRLATEGTGLMATLTDPARPDNPLIYANAAFCEVTGYACEEVIGRNCRFLQGSGTDPRDVARIRKAVAEGRPIDCVIDNHRKDGTPFRNLLRLTPVRCPRGRIEYFFGTQIDLSDPIGPDLRRAFEGALPPAARVPARTLSLYQVVRTVTVLAARAIPRGGPPPEAMRMQGLIDEGIAAMLWEAGRGAAPPPARDLRQLAHAVLAPYALDMPGRLRVSGPALPDDGRLFAAVEAVLAEMAERSAAMPFDRGAACRIAVCWRREREGVTLEWDESWTRGGGAAGLDRPSLAAIERAAARGDGAIDWFGWRDGSLSLKLQMPYASA